jgi:hypothetical protein
MQASFKEKGKVGAKTQFQTLLKSRTGVNQSLDVFGFRAKKEAGKLQKELRLLLWGNQVQCAVLAI